jgi:hypothetical protein
MLRLPLLAHLHILDAGGELDEKRMVLMYP